MSAYRDKPILVWTHHISLYFWSGRFTISGEGKIANFFLENHLKEGYIIKNKNEVVFVSNPKEDLNTNEYKLCIEESSAKYNIKFNIDNKKTSYGLIYCIINSNKNLLVSVNNSLYEINKDHIIRKKEFSSRIICLTIDNDRNVWIGLDKGGVFCFPDGNIDQHPKYHLLKSNSVSYVLKDTEESWWFSTLDDGVFYLPSLAYTSYSIEDGLSGNAVNTVFANNNGIWLGMNSNTIIKIKGTSVSHKVISDNKSLVVNYLYYDSYREWLWIGTNMLAYYIDVKNRQNELFKPHFLITLIRFENNLFSFPR